MLSGTEYFSFLWLDAVPPPLLEPLWVPGHWICFSKVGRDSCAPKQIRVCLAEWGWGEKGGMNRKKRGGKNASFLASFNRCSPHTFVKMTAYEVKKNLFLQQHAFTLKSIQHSRALIFFLLTFLFICFIWQQSCLFLDGSEQQRALPPSFPHTVGLLGVGCERPFTLWSVFMCLSA